MTPPVPVDPSPKYQLYEYGGEPPTVLAVNVMIEAEGGVVGEKVKFVESWLVPLGKIFR